MTRELIEDMREVILPFIKEVLLKTNYEGLGKSDAKVFERDFNEILNLAIKALEQEPTTKNDLGVDCISREQAIEEADKLCLETGYDNEKVEEMLRELPSVTPQEPIWIPVSERLPDTTDDEVLCWYEYYHWSQEKVLPEYGIGRYTSAWFGEVANGKDVRVIAWMPLPKPYEPQESEDKE